MAAALVTGGTGFIGHHLIRALVERGEGVTVLVRRGANTERLQSLGVRLREGDVTDLDSLRPSIHGCSVVYHLAGRVKAFRQEDLHQVNETGVENVCRAAAEVASPPVVVLVSSLAAAGPTRNGLLRKEDDPPQPVSNYGRSKRAGEVRAERFAGTVPITVVRPPIVFGESDRATLEMFRSVYLSNIHFVPGFRPRRFSIIHAADLSKLLIQSSDRGERLPSFEGSTSQPAGKGYYFAACDEHPSYYCLGRMIGKVLGRPWTLTVPLGKSVVRTVAAINSAVGRIRGNIPYFSVDKAREAIAGSWACSPVKARRQLGFAAGASLADRLAQTANWYRRENWL